ncbi:MAG: hypothetical protein R2880_12210 [Deinococcales bacterium]
MRLLAWMFFIWSVALVLAQAVDSPEAAIFKLRVSNCTDERELALTGFLLPSEGGLITALHGVVGCETIHAGNNWGNFRHLSISKVDVKHDVVLLVSPELTELSNQEPLLGLSIGTSQAAIKVISYPLNLSASLESSSLALRGDDGLEFLYNRIPLEELSDFEACGSPDVEIEVYDIEGALRPGESGAPLLNEAFEVIGVVMGGLNRGFDDIAWASRWRDIELVDSKLFEGELSERGAKRCLTDRFADTVTTPKNADLEKTIENLNDYVDRLQLDIAEKERFIESLQENLARYQRSNDETKQQVLELIAENKLDEALELLSDSNDARLAKFEQDRKDLVQDLAFEASLEEFRNPDKVSESA